MTARKFTTEDEAFIQGILVALAVVAIHDDETIYREIVDLQGEADLVWVARKHSDMKLSGLTQYGYGKQN